MQHAFRIIQNLTVPKSDHPNAIAMQNGRALMVAKARAWLIVLATIELNRKLRFTAVEIKNKPVDRMLAAKPEPAKLLPSQATPKQLLGIRHVLPQRTSSFK
jgi:hypothetical protein